MIDRVLAKQDSRTLWVCQWIRDCTFRCGKCARGIVHVWPGENRQGVNQDRKKCRVCGCKFIVTEISR